jgi:hypothetical protein
MIVHVVLFNPKPGIPEARRQEFAEAIQRTCRQVASMRRAIIGRRTEIDAGYARAFGEKTYEYVAQMEFESQQGLVEYLNHPLHEMLGRMFWELCESTVVLECVAVDAKTEPIAKILV